MDPVAFRGRLSALSFSSPSLTVPARGLCCSGGGGAFRGRQMLPYVFRNTCSSTFLPCLWLLTLQALYQTCEKTTEPALTLQD